MKHFFCISSHLAFYICERLIKIDSLLLSDCVFLTTRNYHLPKTDLHYHVVETELNVAEDVGRIFAGWRVWKTRQNISRLDSIIKECTNGDDYIYYTQVCWNDICSVCVTNPHCKGYYIIEDGAGSYMRDNEYTFHGWKAYLYKFILKPLFPRIYTLKNKMVEVNHPKFKGCIATNQLCFPNHQDRLRVIGLPFHPEPLEVVPQALISLDPYYVWLSDEQAEKVLEQLCTFISKQNYRHVVYKPHPYLLTKTNRNRYLLYKRCLTQNIKACLIELGAEVSLENTLMAHKDCDFYTVISSVAIYANAMGVRCYTFAPLVRQFYDVRVPIVEDVCEPITP